MEDVQILKHLSIKVDKTIQEIFVIWEGTFEQLDGSNTWYNNQRLDAYRNQNG